MLVVLLLTSCGMFQQEPQPLPPVKIITEVIKPELYPPPLPRELQIENVRWHVLTRDNIEEKMSEIEEMLGGSFVVFAVTPQAYENMAFNLQEIKRYIDQSQEIISYFIEVTAPQGKEGWITETQARRAAIENAVIEESIGVPVEERPSFFKRLFNIF